MAIRKVDRAGKPTLFIDIRYRTSSGEKRRFRRDAQVQTMAAARAEERRLLAQLAQHGELRDAFTPTATEEVQVITFGEAIERYKGTVLLTKKPSTRIGYREILGSSLLTRLVDVNLGDIDARVFNELDAKLVKQKASPSRRRNFLVVVRSVLRASFAEGYLAAMPALPRLPRVGRSVVHAFPAEALPRLLATAGPAARLAFALAAYAGLRAGEVRGLRWSDVNLRTRTLVVRRAITKREEASPKSGHERLIPIAEPLFLLLELVKVRKQDAPVAPTAHGKVWGESGLLQALERACSRIDLPAYRFHALRHTFVTELLRRGAAAHAVKALAGHSSLAVTERYAHVGERDLRAAITTLS